MCTGEAWRTPGVARSPSHESVTTELSLFSVSSAASDARMLRLLACKAGQGPDPTLRVASPNPEGKLIKRGSCSLQSADACRELLAGCAALCSQLGLRRSFSAGDVAAPPACRPTRSATSEVGLCAALEALTMTAASRSCSTWVAGGSQLPSPQRSHPAQPPQRSLPSDNKKVRQNYIKRRLLTTYRALERMSQSDFNLDKLEAVASAAVDNADPGPTTLAVPPKPIPKFVHPEAAQLALTAADLERERGRPLSKYERNMMIFNWLHTLDEAAPF
ncbi:uncharacterized protein LOC120635314 isoform X1 [Pararge aegeria]|uniref:uncharacterized protein LOC120635314 isoform X1 n=1 Tax=Pararge aegeria TaxID=116150 RepID=UPI0019D30968|nr:uncharacterized protein LOC120635314 isoform X1 [Pararge aegeria]